jgi:hypothetical protein
VKVTDITTKINKHHIIPKFRCKELGIHPDDPLNDTVTVPTLVHGNIHWEHKLGEMELLLSYYPTLTQFQLDNLCLGDKRHGHAAQIIAQGLIEGIDTSGENHHMWGRKGKDNPLFGIPRPKEVREKISKSHMGIGHTEESKKKIGMAQIGRKASEKTKKKMSLAHSGEKHPMWGKHHTEESKRQISASKKGSIPWNKGKAGCFSEETIKKMSEGRKGKLLGKDNHMYGVSLVPWNKGISHSEETKKKMSEDRKGVPNFKQRKEIEYYGKVYIGWIDLKEKTKVSPYLYLKYYKNGINPEPYIDNQNHPKYNKSI